MKLHWKQRVWPFYFLQQSDETMNYQLTKEEERYAPQKMKGFVPQKETLVRTLAVQPILLLFSQVLPALPGYTVN